jgi:hypothetical protein
MDPRTVQIISRARQQELETQIARRLRARESGMAMVMPPVSLRRRLATLLLALTGR